MGNGGSRSSSSQIPRNIRPQLQQRIGEVKKRFQTRGRVNPYKRDFLDEDGEGSGSSSYQFIPARKSSTMLPYDDHRLSCVTAQGSKQGYVTDARETKSCFTQDEGVITYMPATSSPSNIKDYREDLPDKYNRVSVYVESKQDDDENDLGNLDERMLVRRNIFDDFPASPSFRVYCTEDDINRKSFDERFRLENDLVKEETPSEEEEEDQEVEPKKVKQVKMRRSFRKVIPTGGQIKNLLQNVNSCSSKAPGQSRTLTKK